MQLYNTLSRHKEEFVPIQNKEVGLYTCGPTVYDYPHVGNWTGYIYWDVLSRTLRDAGYDVHWYMNITDVGHLVSDADEGEDKLEKGARREGKSAWDIAKFYTEDFKQGLERLNITIDQSHLTPATEHIPEQIGLIKSLADKGFTYQISDGVYFDSTKFPAYGQLARLDIAGLRAGARVDLGDKKHPTDFALWKFSPPGQKRDMEWDSPWGRGFPGWHIECSAMAMKYLGDTIDIHCGGIDHIPVHHTNEIAQSEAATGQKFVNYWLHNNHMLVADEKIAKSAGNGITLQDVEAKGFSAMDFRLLVLQSHFRTQSNFSWENLAAAQNRRRSLQALADLRFQDSPGAIPLGDGYFQKIKSAVREALQDDLNTPTALRLLSEMTDYILEYGRGIQAKHQPDFSDFLSWLDNVLGLNFSASSDISPAQRQLIKQRQVAREAKDFTASDKFRDHLAAEGIYLQDNDGSSWWSRH
jgi:cysteinyl-tRNA synthetase